MWALERSSANIIYCLKKLLNKNMFSNGRSQKEGKEKKSNRKSRPDRAARQNQSLPNEMKTCRAF
jgi:hypothetical protein